MAIIEMAKKDDRKWFAANPGKSERLRRPFDREVEAVRARNTQLSLECGGVPAAGAPANAIYVYQVCEGQRMRLPCWWPEDASHDRVAQLMQAMRKVALSSVVINIPPTFTQTHAAALNKLRSARHI